MNDYRIGGTFAVRADTEPQAREVLLHELSAIMGPQEADTDCAVYALGWTPVSQRPPRGGEPVLVAVAIGGEERITVASFVGGHWDLDREAWAAVDAAVTHWMPLPLPPENVEPEGGVEVSRPARRRGQGEDVGGWVINRQTATEFGVQAARLLAPLARCGEEPHQTLDRLLGDAEKAGRLSKLVNVLAAESEG